MLDSIGAERKERKNSVRAIGPLFARLRDVEYINACILYFRNRVCLHFVPCALFNRIFFLLLLLLYSATSLIRVGIVLPSSNDYLNPNSVGRDVVRHILPRFPSFIDQSSDYAN